MAEIFAAGMDAGNRWVEPKENISKNKPEQETFAQFLQSANADVDKQDFTTAVAPVCQLADYATNYQASVAKQNTASQAQNNLADDSTKGLKAQGTGCSQKAATQATDAGYKQSLANANNAQSFANQVATKTDLPFEPSQLQSQEQAQFDQGVKANQSLDTNGLNKADAATQTSGQNKLQPEPNSTTVEAKTVKADADNQNSQELANTGKPGLKNAATTRLPRQAQQLKSTKAAQSLTVNTKLLATKPTGQQIKDLPLKAASQAKAAKPNVNAKEQAALQTATQAQQAKTPANQVAKQTVGSSQQQNTTTTLQTANNSKQHHGKSGNDNTNQGNQDTNQQGQNQATGKQASKLASSWQQAVQKAGVIIKTGTDSTTASQNIAAMPQLKAGQDTTAAQQLAQTATNSQLNRILAVAQNLSMGQSGKVRWAELNLQHATLGKLNVRLQANQGNLKVVLHAADAQKAEALQEQSQQLHQALTKLDFNQVDLEFKWGNGQNQQAEQTKQTAFKQNNNKKQHVVNKTTPASQQRNWGYNSLEITA